MHLLAAIPGTISDGAQAVDLGQTPGDIVVLSAADSDLACLAAAQQRLVAGDAASPSLRLASLLKLGHNYSVDLYLEKVAGEAKLIVARILGGRGYWNYGVERLSELARARGIKLALLPGDDKPDAELAHATTVTPDEAKRLWRYLVEGGAGNAERFLRYAASLVGRGQEWREPAPILRAGLYWPGADRPDLDALRRQWKPDSPVAALIFYRALVLAANTAPIDALIASLAARGLNPLPVFVSSLKDAESAAILSAVLGAAAPDIVLNATAFAVSTGTSDDDRGPFAAHDCPVLQVIFAGGDEMSWRAGARGLDARARRSHHQPCGVVQSGAGPRRADRGGACALSAAGRPHRIRRRPRAELGEAAPHAETRTQSRADPRQLSASRRPHRQWCRPRYAAIGDQCAARAQGRRLPR
jgi:cobaltochelatase CobN